MVTPAQLWEVGQLLDPDKRVVVRRLQRLSHGVGQYNSYYHRQDVGDLTSQLTHNDRSWNGVGDRSRQGCSTCGWGRTAEQATLSVTVSSGTPRVVLTEYFQMNGFMKCCWKLQKAMSDFHKLQFTPLTPLCNHVDVFNFMHRVHRGGNLI